MKIRRSLIAGAVAFVLTLIASHLRSTPYNNYVLFANAVLHGRLWIDWPGPYIDAVLWNGHRFIVNDPLPGFLMIPFVALFGVAANQTFLAVILCAIAVGAAWELCERLDCEPAVTVWLCAFYLIGSDLLWCSMLGDVWFIAQTSAVACMTLALVEMAGRNRMWVVMLFYAGAIASRFTVVMALPAVASIVLAGGLRGDGRLRLNWPAIKAPLLQLCAVMIPATLLWCAYNIVRWGVPWDSGHTVFFHQDAIGSQSGSPFALSHVPYQLWSFFVQYPDFSNRWPWIRPSFSGVALTWTAPALALAFLAWRPRPLVIALWIAVILAAGPSLLYYVNGFAQYGMRHALDFIPFLFVLMILGVRRKLPLCGVALIAYSCLAQLYGVWYWNAVVRPGN